MRRRNQPSKGVSLQAQGRVVCSCSLRGREGSQAKEQQGPTVRLTSELTFDTIPRRTTDETKATDTST